MRKIIFLLGLVFLCGCKDQGVNIGITPDNTVPFGFVTHFEYKNHQYIKFRTTMSTASIGGVVHDPDCKYCNIKEHEK